ncbi:MAG: hypothetical protein HQK97_04635 [Nitrospirae bacterium]|nr:hypothetical protein [Nitrospirota bacterium]
MAANSTFPAVPGYKSLGAGTIPKEYSPKLEDKFYQKCILPYIANTDHEDEIREQGDKVYIRKIPTVNTFYYTKGMKIDYQRPNVDSTELIIDKGVGWACAIDRVEQWQTDIDYFDVWADDASHQTKIKVELDIFTNIPAMVDPLNQGLTAGNISHDINLGALNTPIQITKNNVLDYILDSGTVCDEYNLPQTGRWLIIPAWMAAMCKKSDLAKVFVTGDSISPLRNGHIGNIDTFEVYVSNLLSTVTDPTTHTTCFNVMFGHKSGLTFAGQSINMEMLLGESSYGTLVRGLQIYGYNVIKPDALGLMYVTR